MINKLQEIFSMVGTDIDLPQIIVIGGSVGSRPCSNFQTNSTHSPFFFFPTDNQVESPVYWKTSSAVIFYPVVLELSLVVHSFSN